MKNILLIGSVFAFALGSPAFAADAVVEELAPAAAAVTTYDWSGPYIGVFGGLATGDYEYEAGAVGGPALGSADVSGGGVLGGVQVGYDHQVGSWVFGAVADIALTNHEAEISGDIAGVGDASAEATLNYYGTVRARAGYAFDRALIYAHGGFAYGRTEQTITAGGATLYNDDVTRTGWTIGAGAEYALTEKLTFGVEYAYVDLGNKEIFAGDIGAPADVFIDEDVKFHTVKAMLNYRF